MPTPTVLLGIEHWHFLAYIENQSAGTRSIEFTNPNGDTLTIHYGSSNTPSAWQAVVDGVVYVDVPANGDPLELTQQQWDAFQLFAGNPSLLSALQTYQAIFNSVRGNTPPPP